MDKAEIIALFEKYIRKLRITPAWDVRLEFVFDFEQYDMSYHSVCAFLSSSISAARCAASRMIAAQGRLL